MAGFDRNRFIDLSESMAKDLECSICLNIFDNPIDTDCCHTFCKECLQKLIRTRAHKCPACRTEFTRKRGTNAIILSGYAFRPNLMANAWISKLITKCDFQFNGCKERLELGSMATHLISCEHRFCSNCNEALNAGQTEAHHCVELLKNERDQLKNQLDIVKSERDQLKSETDQLKNQLNLLKNERQELRSDNNSMKNEMAQLKRERDQLKSETDPLRTEMDALKNERECLKSDKDALKNEMDQLKRSKDQLEKEHAQLQRNFILLFEERDRFKSERDQSTLAEQHLKSANDSMNSEMGELKVKVEKAETLVKDLSRQIKQGNEMEKEMSKLKEKSNEWKRKYDEANEKIDSGLSEHTKQDLEIKRLKNLLSTNTPKQKKVKNVQILEQFTKFSFRDPKLLIGRYMYQCRLLEADSNGIKLFNISAKENSPQIKQIIIAFEYIQGLICCPLHKSLIIKPTTILNQTIQQALNIESPNPKNLCTMFDLNSKGKFNLRLSLKQKLYDTSCTFNTHNTVAPTSAG